MKRTIQFLAVAACLLASALADSQVPAGTEIEIRLKTKLSSDNSRPNDAFEAVVIAPVLISDRLIVAPGAKLYGKVKEVKSIQGKTDERAHLALEFNELEDASGSKVKLSAKLKEVDNARETVDEQGAVVGILASETISARMGQGLDKLGRLYSGLGGFLDAVRGAAMKDPQPEIVLSPGTEMTLKITEKLEIKSLRKEDSALQPPTGLSLQELATFAAAQPFQTMAAKPSKPSDITNLMLIGSQESIEAAFAEAEWTTAAALSRRTALETFRAIAEERGYKESPVSLLLLEDKKPDLVFQKQNNTFAKRHHLRIWRRPEPFQSKTVWVSSATHDTGIAFSPENRTFIHKIDSNIDNERSKVVNDLRFTGRVKYCTMVDRPEVPKESSNATGDKLITDGKIAVLFFE